jgi:SNF2 family DNA or RNA helicase
MTTLPFDIGSKVRCRNQVWEVIKISNNQDGTWTVRMFPDNGGRPQPFLYPLTAIEPIATATDHLLESRIDHIDHYRLLTNATRLSLVYEYDKLLSISNSKIVPEPYQLLAVKKVMESLRQRFLIADDVGLGKTIEAGLIMQELAARKRGDRVLIVVPAALQDQWKKEMQRHFLRSFTIYNRHTMLAVRQLVDENLNPWLARNAIITSIDWIKPEYEGTGSARRNTNPYFDQLMQVERRWDLVIIDESHYVSTDSNRAELARAIQERCDSLLLVTATPHSGKPEHFFNLLNLIDPFMFAHVEDLDRPDARERVDKIMIRRGKETIFERNEHGELVKKFREREPHPIEIEFSPAERTLYEEVTDYTSEGWVTLSRKRSITASERNIGRFLLTLVQQRMVSSLFALRETLARRIESVVEERTTARLAADRVQLQQLFKEYTSGGFMEDEDRELVERYLETRRVQAVYADRTTEVKRLRGLMQQADALIASGQDSKLQWLTSFLQQLFAHDPTEKVIVFTQYRDTLDYLKRHLTGLWFFGPQSIVEIHGGMVLGESDAEVGSKLHAERRFNEPDTRLLLATDAASEGLNLQRHCHIMVNYELPWNPNRLEQRIGRIHRYGQRRTVQVYNLMVKDSKEAEIFKTLQERIETIRRQLGNMAEVLGVLDRVPLDELILRVLDRSIDKAQAAAITEHELKRLDEIVQSLRQTHFLSGVRQFAEAEIDSAEHAIAAAREAIPQYTDVQDFVETFLRVYGDAGSGEKDGRKLHPTAHKGVYRLRVPSVIQDDKLPKQLERVAFSREIANRDWVNHEAPDLLAFGHPLLERMVHYCRVTRAADLGGKLSYIVTDYAGLPGVVFNFLLRFEDQKGRVIREELEPIFVDLEAVVQPTLGRKIYLAPTIPRAQLSEHTLEVIRGRFTELRAAAEAHIRSQYQRYYARVERTRQDEIRVLLEDLERFDRGVRELYQGRLLQLQGGLQAALFEDIYDATTRGQRTRVENELRSHTHRMDERRREIESMQLGAFPAPELLNMVIVTPA